MSVDIKKSDWGSDPVLDDMVKAQLCDIFSTLDAHTLSLDLNERLEYSKFSMIF